ncbi:DEAD/DEAH box helicase [Metabacillus sediminilitoris]|uniref:DEAD/DEAH box helicase n=1 Tax=Metabacillus sediminilitoris TaxID=2567941 RepID=A0A4S4C6I5_9BACI|nr:DEAD/DEAH box helicase [Metabacillus sediminilitoris]QGQ48286.1 ATP-dependent helicase [Metabacillus sediminilitoris]THF81356.1 DEAD/DEAH box helicase [Metabacillus sediminilitoris]
MINMVNIVVHAEQIEDYSFYVYCTAEHDERPLEVAEFSRSLFTWHESSFFGTNLEDITYIGTPAVLLSPWMMVEMLGKETFNSLATISFTEETKKLAKTAKEIYELIASGSYVPDFASWKHGVTRFKDAANKLEGFALEWFSAALADMVEKDTVLRNAWADVVNSYPVLTTFQGHFIDEGDFLEKIGWQLDDTPFSVGLRLNEPETDGDDWQLEILLRSKVEEEEVVHFQGEGELPKKWRPYVHKIEREQERFANVVPWLSFRTGTTYVTEDEAWLFLTDASETLINMGVEILLPSWWQVVKESQLMLKAKVSSSPRGQSFVGMNSLIDFNWRFATNGVEMSEEEFLALVSQQRRLVNFKGQWIKLDPAFIKQVQAILKRADREGLHLSDILHQELGAKDLDADYDEILDTRAFANIQIELNQQMKSMLKKLTDTSELPTHEIPDEFLGTLRPYQQNGVDWLLFLRSVSFGACLADDMGLGKTIQMIAYFSYVKDREKPEQPALIIAPTSVLGNWQKEFEKFAPHFRVKLHYGGNRKFAESVKDADVVLTSYGLSHADFEDISSITWSTICLDEAQNIKNAHTKQSRAIRKLRGQHHIALTGTPMENRLTELWSIYDFLNRGYLGSLHSFHKHYVLPIEKERDVEQIEQLQRYIKPFLLRRTKRDEQVALNLPDKQEQKEYVPLSIEQASLYEQLVKDTFEQVNSLAGMQRKALILKMLGKLKQICNHPALYLKEQVPKQLMTRSHKIEKLIELTTNIREQQESCLIFTQYIGMGEMMKSLLEKEFGERVLFLNGSVMKNERDRMVDAFQNKEFPILILSLKAGGTGLNLTAANHVIHYDRWWNPAVENQATDRAYRIGQDRFVHVHKLITTGTIEEKIDEMLEKKQTLNDEIIQSENWITELSADELEELFTLSMS